ncbi:ribonuclease H-like domain-containing protein [Planococcus beigongshangi]|uniref:ribonuclease H-like domain-containing protein n=1 Tax=Planococcus beigongshangi TaxID=2782536 RepID=UPI00193B2AC6|nr:ribonuclease H-like domain-containing protein [Planococcus beigongshangi]
MSFENKLLQMKGMLKKDAGAKSRPKTPKQNRERPAHESRWQEIGLELVENDLGFVFKKTIVYPFERQHGNIQLNELGRVLEAWENAGFDHPFKLGKDERILFFDTETTGLSGTGAYIFLAGLLEMKKDGFEMVQFVMPDPSNEAAFLYETGLWKSKEPIIFSYNGKSFDWPQLASRWTMHRKDLPKLKPLRQIDLFHGTKRIWKNELARMKLSTIEEEKLGFKREGDVPGFLIPAIYLDAVKSGYPEALEKVLLHNELDILSLVSLYVLSSDLLMKDLESETFGAYTNIGKWYADLKQFDQSAAYLEHVTAERGASSALARYLLAIQRKRSGQFEEALKLFKEAAPNLRGPVEVEAWLHAAKLYEHQMKDPEQASIMAGFAKEASMHLKVRASLAQDIEKRLNRLELKKQKNRPSK